VVDGREDRSGDGHDRLLCSEPCLDSTARANSCPSC
jgi:hypothetical protein